MAVLQRSAVYQSARKRPGFTSQAERARLLSQPLRQARSVRAESSQGSVQARVAELNSCPAQPLMPQSHRGVGAVVGDVGDSEPEYVEMDPFARKGKGKAWRVRVRAEEARKGPPVRAEEVAEPVGVVGEGARSNTPGHVTRESGVSVLPVSQCTPPQQISVCQGMFDELDFLEWRFQQNGSSNKPNTMHDTRNQPEFSYFSWTREAG